MTDRQIILQSIEETIRLKELLITYQEIAVLGMRKIRTKVLKNREFIQGLNFIYQEVKSSYRDELMRIMKKKKIVDTKLSLIKRNGKTMSIFLSTNTGLYGAFVGNTYRIFMDYVLHNATDVMIIGRYGKRLYETEQGPMPRGYGYFDFPDRPQGAFAKKILSTLIPYEKVIVFYGEFESVIQQRPKMLDIYGNQPEAVKKTPKVLYLFEPSIEEVFVFFETEIFVSLLDQTIQESHLSKNASRILALDSAVENLDERLKGYQKKSNLIKHRTYNKKQLESLVGISLWR